MAILRPVTTEHDIEAVALLADTIWREHYTAIIGRGQVDYMLERFQSPSAIAGQIGKGYEYYLVADDHGNRGYLALVPDPENARLMISKIYVSADARGKGLGRRMLDFAEDLCRRRGCRTVWLTVNKYNADSIAWYRRNGFRTVDSVIQDIGNGYAMDDYVMEKTVGSIA